MKFLQRMWLKLLQPLRSLSRFFAQAGEQRKLRLARNGDEAERLDRIRNPDKYRGK